MTRLLPRGNAYAHYAAAAGLAGVVLLLLPVHVSAAGITAVFGLAFALALAAAFPRAGLALLVAYVVRLALAAFDTYVTHLPSANADAVAFANRAASLSSQPVDAVLAKFKSGSPLVPWLASWLYRWFGESPMMIKTLMAMLGVLTVLAVYRLARELWRPEGGRTEAAGARAGARRGGAPRMAAYVAALFPTLALFSSIFLREAPIALLAALFALHAARWFRLRRAFDLVLAVLAAVAAAGFHTGMVALLPALALAELIEAALTVRAVRWLAALRLGASVALVAAAMVAMSATGWGLGKLHSSFANVNVQTVHHAQTARVKGGAAYLPGYIVSSKADLFTKGPVRLVYFLFSPFPWMVHARHQALGLLDSLLYLAAFVMMALRWRRLLGDARARAVLIALLVTASAFALGVSNYGAAIRHRAKLAPLVIVLALAPPSRREAEAQAEEAHSGAPAARAPAP